MKHKYLTAATLVLLSVSTMHAQSAFDAYQVSQTDLKGTARYMSMGGAFGALGGDLSTLSSNPGGIGVYRSSDIGFTVDLDMQSSTSKSGSLQQSMNQTKFLLNNIGVVGTWRLGGGLRNLNFGFTYNKAASFNRLYGGRMNDIGTSMTNYIAGVSNANNLTIADVHSTSNYDPYFPNDGGYESPWISILGYDSYLTNPVETTGPNGETVTDWYGQMGDGTRGNAWYSVEESGGVDEYNLSIGGNINDIIYWGMDFGIFDINYTAHTYYGETLTNPYLPNAQGTPVQNTDPSTWDIYNYYNINGNGFNYKLGFIVKPVQELRLGFAFHTPTWYSLTQNYYANVQFDYPGMEGNGHPGIQGMAETNGGRDAYSNFNLRTPWRLIFSAATVLPVLNGFIVSADYEWQPYSGMHLYDSGYDGWYQGQYYEAYGYENQDIKNYYKQMNTVRVGAELRLTPQWSIRAGYVNQSSPVKPAAKAGDEQIYTAGTRPQYMFDNSTSYITCGAGYKYKKFYIDAAYVYKHRSSEYHAFESDAAPGSPTSPSAAVTSDDSQVVLTMGFRF